MEERSATTGQSGTEEVRAWKDDYLARFSDGDFDLYQRAASGVRLVAMVKVAEPGDVRPEEVRVWWQGDRCWLEVRGHLRYLDVQRQCSSLLLANPGEGPEPDDEIDDVTMQFDQPNERGDLIARFEQDSIRGALYLARPPEPELMALIHVYDIAEWPDVTEDEVHVWWEGDRCWVDVRGRRRYIDVQEDTREPAQQPAAAA